MNTQQAKKLSLPDIMSILGYQPFLVKKGGTEIWYLSPFRKEAKPSFVTSYLGGKWIWKDFGDKGGTVLDFVMRHEGTSSISDALTFLGNLYGIAKGGTARFAENKPDFFSFKQQGVKDASSFEPQLEFIKASAITNPVILKYLTEKRCLSENVCRKYLQEIIYRNKTNGKEFFAFGMENRSGGFEIRAATDDFPFKSALICRDITIIKGANPNNQTLFVFEGMTDFLSLLTLNKVDTLDGDAMIMHSLSSFEKSVTFIQLGQVQKVELYLDNDEAGQEVSEKFIIKFARLIISKNEIYFKYKDLNDMLKQKMKFI